MPDFSSIKPMKTNSGTAISNQLLNMPENVRETPVERNNMGTSANTATVTPMAESTKATGYPENIPINNATHITMGQKYSIMRPLVCCPHNARQATRAIGASHV